MPADAYRDELAQLRAGTGHDIDTSTARQDATAHQASHPAVVISHSRASAKLPTRADSSGPALVSILARCGRRAPFARNGQFG
jgi:hypothetical protein